MPTLWLHLMSELRVGNEEDGQALLPPPHTAHSHMASKPLDLPLRVQGERTTSIGTEFLPTVTWG